MSTPEQSPRAVPATGKAREPELEWCQEEIWPSWANRWVKCGSVIQNGRCAKYGHEQDPDTTREARL